MRLATREDFFGHIYTHYRHHEGYVKRARLFRSFPEPFLIVGCGFGFLVSEFLRSGKECYGIEASEYAVDSRENDHVWWASILSDVDVTLLQAQLGIFETVITEDLLPYLTDDEVIIASGNCQKLGPFVVHMVTESGQGPLNYHSTGYWMSLTNQLTISLEGM